MEQAFSTMQKQLSIVTVAASIGLRMTAVVVGKLATLTDQNTITYKTTLPPTSDRTIRSPIPFGLLRWTVNPNRANRGRTLCGSIATITGIVRIVASYCKLAQHVYLDNRGYVCYTCVSWLIHFHSFKAIGGYRHGED